MATETAEPEVKNEQGFEDVIEPEDHVDESEFQPEVEEKAQVDEDPIEETKGENNGSEAEGEQKSDVAKKEEASDPKIDALIERARDLGLEDNDIGQFDTADALEKALVVYERRLMASLRPQQAPQQTNVPQPQQAKEIQKPAEDIPDLDPAEFDERIVKGWGAMKSIVANLREQNQQFATHFAKEQGKQEDSRFDGLISKLGAEYEQFLGKGSVEELKTDSKEFKTRTEVWQAMDSLRKGYANLGRQMPSDKALFERAVQSVLGQNMAEIERKKIGSTLKKRSGQFIGRATHREGVDSRTPDDRARAAVRAKLRDMGKNEDVEDETF